MKTNFKTDAFIKNILIISIALLSCILETYSQDIRKYNLIDNDLNKKINGLWIVDSTKSENFQGEITITNIEFNPVEASRESYKDIINTYINKYGFKRTWSDVIDILISGNGNISFYSFKSSESLPRKLKFCFFKDNNNFMLLIDTDLEDRNEDISLLFDVNSLTNENEEIIINHKELGKFCLHKK